MGVLIVLDGIDGCGKSTQVKLLVEDLKKSGVKTTTTKWKDSAYIQDLFIGDLIKRIHGGEAVIPPEARTFLLGADLSHRIENIIKSKLADDYVVIGDRYAYKIIAQGIARGLDKEWLKTVFNFIIEPDLNIIIDISPELACDRITKYREITFYEAGLDVNPSKDRKKAFIEFQKSVRKSIIGLAEKKPGIIIDGSKSIKTQHREITEFVSDFLIKKGIINRKIKCIHEAIK